VDAKRVACTGNSGGGTHTTYLSALDDRIQVAAPSCFISSWHQMLRTIGPQDAEQVFPNWLKDAWIIPISFTRSRLSPTGFFQRFAISFLSPAPAKRLTRPNAYMSALAQPDKLTMFEATTVTDIRTAPQWPVMPGSAAGSQRGGPEAEPKIDVASAQELACTPTGKWSTSRMPRQYSR